MNSFTSNIRLKMMCMTYATLLGVKEELQINSGNTLYDQELNDLLATIDGNINTRLQRRTSLPVNTEIASQLADVEVRWVAARYRIRRATPQENQQYQAVLAQIENQFTEFLKSNFQTSFFVESPESDQGIPYDNGRRDWGLR